MTSTERTALELFQAAGATVLRSGWPDLLVRDHHGRDYAVEVKAPGDRVRPNQRTMHAALAALGVCTVVAVVHAGRLHVAEVNGVAAGIGAPGLEADPLAGPLDLLEAAARVDRYLALPV